MSVVFILPTVSPIKYRGKYPTRARSISGSTSRNVGRHIELNDGTRLWSATDRTPEFSAGSLSDDYASVKARAVPMSAGHYEKLKEAGLLARTRIEIAGHGRRERLEADVRAIVVAIQPEPAAPAPAPVHSGADIANAAPLCPSCANYGAAQGDCATCWSGPAAPKASQHASHFWQHDAKTDEHCRDCGATWDGNRAAAPCKGPTAPAPVRRDNVEYHAGRVAMLAGKPESDCPYLAGGERAARWALGWGEADTRPHIVAGRSVDGTEYLTPQGWANDYRAALIMAPADAREIARREELKAAATRSPDRGVYQIAAHVWEGPRLFTMADYEASEADNAALEAYLAANA